MTSENLDKDMKEPRTSLFGNFRDPQKQKKKQIIKRNFTEFWKFQGYINSHSLEENEQRIYAIKQLALVEEESKSFKPKSKREVEESFDIRIFYNFDKQIYRVVIQIERDSFLEGTAPKKEKLVKSFYGSLTDMLKQLRAEAEKLTTELLLEESEDAPRSFLSPPDGSGPTRLLSIIDNLDKAAISNQVIDQLVDLKVEEIIEREEKEKRQRIREQARAEVLKEFNKY